MGFLVLRMIMIVVMVVVTGVLTWIVNTLHILSLLSWLRAINGLGVSTIDWYVVKIKSWCSEEMLTDFSAVQNHVCMPFGFRRCGVSRCVHTLYLVTVDCCCLSGCLGKVRVCGKVDVELGDLGTKDHFYS